MRNLIKQMTLAEQAATSKNRYASKYDEKAALRQEWKFWQTQPVPTIGTKIDTSDTGPIEPNKPIDELRQEPYKLPDGFSWDDIDINVNEQVY
jgi:glycylpeptide N-tetradecanoyltransferase